jgi:hypothetical protein
VAGCVLGDDLGGGRADEQVLERLLQPGQADRQARPVGDPVFLQFPGRLAAHRAGHGRGDAVKQPQPLPLGDQPGDPGEAGAQPVVADRAEPDQLEELGGRRLADPAEYLARGQPGHAGQAARGPGRVRQAAGNDADGVDQGGRGERGSLRVQQLGAQRHRADHGQAQPGPQPGNDDGRGPHHLPGGAHPAQPEGTVVLPRRPAAAEVDVRVEAGLRRLAPLGDAEHGQGEIGRSDLLVGVVQRRSHLYRSTGRQRGGRIVLAVFPGEQEGLHRTLGGWLGRRPAEKQPGQQQRGRDRRGHHPGPRRARASTTHPCFPDSFVTCPNSPGPGAPDRRARLGGGLAGVCASVMRADHGPALRYLRRRKARSTSLAASLRARSWRLS